MLSRSTEFYFPDYPYLNKYAERKTIPIVTMFPRKAFNAIDLSFKDMKGFSVKLLGKS